MGRLSRANGGIIVDAYKVKIIKSATHGGQISDRINAHMGQIFIIPATDLEDTMVHDNKAKLLTLTLDGVETRLVPGEYEILASTGKSNGND